MNFEDTLKQYEPMISASIRKLNIYRDHESFRQAGRVALWQAWSRFDETKGNFTPFAYRSIRGAMLDELKREGRFEEHVTQTEDDLLIVICGASTLAHEWSDNLSDALVTLSSTEQQLVQWLFLERWTLGECAERSGITVAGIKKRRQRMLVKLKEILTKQ
ncbi:sigma-70 family RNA polymerase sigma factor [Sporosarcina sp. FSL K6-3457]|uniref:sigma-70 family RNA polymerase sigma factor n=1 Tax=Sporosarcina sp. FSL K6-3457 TaxID=2978204 RepID=UPI0030FB60C5